MGNGVVSDDPMMWLRSAACKGVPLDLFFVDAGRSLSEESAQLCRACPVRRECVSHAFDRDLIAGYFGGFSPGQRRSMTLDEALARVEQESA